jgi:hypothetical protein
LRHLYSPRMVRLVLTALLVALGTACTLGVGLSELTRAEKIASLIMASLCAAALHTITTTNATPPKKILKCLRSRHRVDQRRRLTAESPQKKFRIITIHTEPHQHPLQKSSECAVVRSGAAPSKNLQWANLGNFGYSTLFKKVAMRGSALSKKSQVRSVAQWGCAPKKSAVANFSQIWAQCPLQKTAQLSLTGL